ncbi:glycerate kinase [Planococcus halotolerans]|uniref:Glycerate kinase n=2 Tax=Planococcus halotolerans TaxID=2233542 RepID=A0A365L0L1_9BACL|nr:glycerate kinase [Planococcus halotolerans]
MMKIVISPDSFKGSMTSMQASSAINRAVHEIIPEAETALYPMADGGEGTVEAVLRGRDGDKISCRVQDPLGRDIDAVYGWIDREKTAIIETAAASGLPLLKPGELDPETASSYGTGQLIKDAIGRGAKTILLGLGGSATVDAGTGLFQALGLKFFDHDKKEIAHIGGRLDRILSIDTSGLIPALSSIKFIVASDVTNPLLGKEGAIAVFGPQKGVKRHQLESFEEGMRQFSVIAAQTAGRDMSAEAGSGAAGGIGFLLKTFLEVEFRNGLDLIVEMLQLEKQLAGADLILTGEGRIDGQSLFGKVPVGIGRLAGKRVIPVIAFAGSIGPGVETLEQEGIQAVMPIVDGPMSLEEALQNGEALLYESAKRLMRILLIANTIEAGNKG